MTTVTLKGNPFQIFGVLPATGESAPDFSLVKTDLSVARRDDFKGKKTILNIFPSLDTAVCAASVRKFNAEAAGLPGVNIVCVSKDLPFAHSRFCTTEGIENLVNASTFRDNNFGKDYGVMLTEGPLEGLLARSVVALDEEGKVIYSQLVPEITEEPDYEAALAVVK